jgi:4-amino-4-deoxy-L-arabinose transferase-like glycosyltransferase
MVIMRRMLHLLTRRDTLFVLALVAVIAAALPVLAYPPGRDQGMYANIGRAILDGGVPYKAMWDIKPPPIYYLYAFVIGLFGPAAWSIRMLDFLFAPLTLYALYRIGLRLMNRRAALLVVVLFGVFYFNEQFASLSQSDSLVTLPMTLAIWAVLAAGDAPRASRRAVGHAVLAGALCGFILWFKHYYAFFVAALVVQQILTRRALPWREALGFAFGGLLTGGTLLLYFWALGMIDEMLIVAQGTAAYNAAGYDFNTFVSSMGNYLRFRWQQWHAVLLLAALWLPARAFGPRRSGWRLILLWLAAGLAFVAIQAKGFDTHWIPLLPALCLLAADTLDRLIYAVSAALRLARPARASLYSIGGVLLLGVLVSTTWVPFIPYATGAESLRQYYGRFQANDVKPAESLAIARFLEREVARGDTVFIWGFRPEVAYLAGLRPATRFQAHFPLVADGYPPAWRQENVDTLWAALPPYVLVMQADWMPWVTGRDKDSHELLVEYTALNDWLAFNYDFDQELGDFLIWKRKASPG